MASASAHPRAARTRSALIAAGFDLLVERPIDAIAIDEVVARAGVAKGSFFNHFADKQAFARAIADEVRHEVEALVTAANTGIADPVERIAGGMRVVARFALTQPRRTMVLLRSQGSSTSPTHPLNKGLRDDMAAAAAQGLVLPDAREHGVLYWLGLCQILMVSLVEQPPGDAAARVAAMLRLGLAGLGIAPAVAAAIAARQAALIA